MTRDWYFEVESKRNWMVRILSYLKISCICRHVPWHLLQPFWAQDPSRMETLLIHLFLCKNYKLIIFWYFSSTPFPIRLYNFKIGEWIIFWIVEKTKFVDDFIGSKVYTVVNLPWSQIFTMGGTSFFVWLGTFLIAFLLSDDFYLRDFWKKK